MARATVKCHIIRPLRVRDKCHLADELTLQPENNENPAKERVGAMLDVLDYLFPGNPLVHVAASQSSSSPMRCSPRTGLRIQQFARAHFTVPSPAIAMTGANKSGKPSTRCLANTDRRYYIVIESDKIPMDDQARVLLHLSKFLKLMMVVDSQGKSMHGWFKCDHHITPDQEAGAQAVFASHVGKFMRMACLYGADPALYVRCQLVRMPFGFRPGEPDKAHKGEHYAHDRIQNVLYLARK